ncbi:hypothetical protein [Haladaptatus caseinilyticus]|uniref:hypothetical protein n=1 Tax=Haladaptatus caseinilyticus TaxID=2993314 RepID=UPI00224A8F2A|nr:hypothetical protein [Haladaptatus caseinilyticus]
MSRDIKCNESGASRRSILRAVGSSASVGFGMVSFSGAASAKKMDLGKLERVKQIYRDESTAEAAFNRIGKPLLTELVSRGYLHSSYLRVDMLANGGRRHEARLLATKQDGIYTTQIGVRHETEFHEVDVHVQPERNRAFAYVETKATGERLKFDTRFDEPIRVNDCYRKNECEGGCYEYQPPVSAGVVKDCCVVPPTDREECDVVDTYCHCEP